MRMMASKAPLVLAAALFVLGIAGLAATVRQTGDGATPAPLSEILVSRPPAPSPSAPSTNIAASVEAVSDTAAPSPSAVATRQQSSTFAAPVEVAPPAPTATEEPTPDSRGGAIAAGVASDGDESVANATTTPLNPLRFGMVGRDEADETPGPTETATPDPAVTPEPETTSTPAPEASATPTP